MSGEGERKTYLLRTLDVNCLHTVVKMSGVFFSAVGAGRPHLYNLFMSLKKKKKKCCKNTKPCCS